MAKAIENLILFGSSPLRTFKGSLMRGSGPYTIDDGLKIPILDSLGSFLV